MPRIFFPACCFLSLVLLQEDGSSFEEGMLKLLRTLPKVLKYLPSDKAKDARNFMMSFQVCTAAAAAVLNLPRPLAASVLPFRANAHRWLVQRQQKTRGGSNLRLNYV